MIPIKVLPQDLREKARIEKMKVIEEQRRKRIFNPKERLIGIDKCGIQRQIEDKRREREMIKAIEKKHHEYIISAAAIAEKEEKQLSEIKKRQNLELNWFRETQQRKEDRREYDISNPSEVVQYQYEPGISSGQIFDGEDINRSKRKALQVEQQKVWLIQQISEKFQTEKEKEMAEKIYMNCFNTREERAKYLDKLEKDCRRQIDIANKAYNEALAREKSLIKKAKSERELEEKLAHMVNTINSNLLLENRDVAQSNLGQNKIIQYHYKGMTQDELMEIREAQLRQIEQRKANVQEESFYNKEWDKFVTTVDDILMRKGHQQSIQQREYLRNIMEENKILNLEKRFQERCQRMKEQSNYTTPEFLSKFNKSSR